MRNFVRVLILLGVVSVGFSGCNKYDEGPAFSLRSKTFRATNNWFTTVAAKNGIDVTADTRIGINLKSDGTVVYQDTVATAEGDIITERRGVWEFDNSAENLLLVFTNPGGGAIGAKIWYILRLTTDELWVTETIGQDLYRYEFEPQE